MRAAVAVLSLLAGICLSGAASAATFTLAELDSNTGTVDGFTIGNLEFFDFTVLVTTARADLITIETVTSPFVPGFTVNGNGQWSIMGNEQPGVNPLPERLDFTYQVRTVDQQPLIGGAILLANDYSIENGTALNLMLDDVGQVVDPFDLDVTIFEPFGLPITNSDDPADSVNLIPRVASLMLDSNMALSVAGDLGPQGPGAVNSYTMLFPVVVPEPGTALLMGLGLAGLGIGGRSKRAHSEGAA